MVGWCRETGGQWWAARTRHSYVVKQGGIYNRVSMGRQSQPDENPRSHGNGRIDGFGPMDSVSRDAPAEYIACPDQA